MCHFREVKAGRKRPNKNPVVGQWRCATKMNGPTITLPLFLFFLPKLFFKSLPRRSSDERHFCTLLAFVDPRCAAALDFVCCAGCCNNRRTWRKRRWLLFAPDNNGVALLSKHLSFRLLLLLLLQEIWCAATHLHFFWKLLIDSNCSSNTWNKKLFYHFIPLNILMQMNVSLQQQKAAIHRAL